MQTSAALKSLSWSAQPSPAQWGGVGWVDTEAAFVTRVEWGVGVVGLGWAGVVGWGGLA